MGYHHLALFTHDIHAIHEFYEGVLGFELVKVEVQPHSTGGWAKHFFYRMEDDSKFIAFWELHDVEGANDAKTDISEGVGLPAGINHIAFDVHSREELDARRAQWTAAGLQVLEVDHNWCRSIYTRDPNGNMVEFCLTTGAFDAADRARALEALDSNTLQYSEPPGGSELHAPTAA